MHNCWKYKVFQKKRGENGDLLHGMANIWLENGDKNSGIGLVLKLYELPIYLIWICYPVLLMALFHSNCIQVPALIKPVLIWPILCLVTLSTIQFLIINGTCHQIWLLLKTLVPISLIIGDSSLSSAIQKNIETAPVSPQITCGNTYLLLCIRLS